MSLLTEANLLDKYGPLLDPEQLAGLLRIELGTLRNKISARSLGVAPVKCGSKMLFRAADVAQYIDNLPKVN
jgi:hypothetical protein